MGNEMMVISKIRVFERDGKQWTTSLNIAKVFGKEHKNIIRDIENLECSEGFRLLNFEPSSYANSQNKEQPMYELTKDGFSFLVMGFTGAKAAQFKEAYIEAFNKMESCIREQSDVNDRFLIMSERFHNDHLELQRKNQEILDSLSGSFHVIGGRVEKVEIDISDVKSDVAEIKSEISNFKNVIPLSRRKISKADRRVHTLFVFDHFTGQCPICRTQIVDASRQPKESFCIDHEINRHERALDQTWAICKSCNTQKSNGNLQISERDCRSLFDAYHTQLRIWQAKKPVQLQIEIK